MNFTLNFLLDLGDKELTDGQMEAEEVYEI